MADDVPPRWLIAFGVAWSAAVGAILLLLLRRSQGPALPPINIWNNIGAAPGTHQIANTSAGPVPVTVAPQPLGSVTPARLSTYTLSTTDGQRVMTAAGPNFWRVQLRNVGPPGSIARVASELTNLNSNMMSIAIPAGGFNEVRVAPGDALFAIADIAGTQLSVAATEDVPG